MKLFSLLLACAFVAMAAEPERMVLTHTDHLDLPANGVLHLAHSTGEVTVTGWDRPDVEIVTIRSTKLPVTGQAKEKATAFLDRIHITAERKGDEVMVTTEYPKRLTVPLISQLHGVATSFDLEYRIMAPRSAKLVIDHNEGDIHVEDLTGDIQAHSHQGEISLHLAGDAPRAITARTLAGDVVSDFPGTKRGKWWVGNQYTQDDPKAQKLTLHIGYGDIILLKMQRPVL